MIIINQNKAILIAQNKIRAWRETEFAKNDILIQNALVDGDKPSLEVAKARRGYLRDVPQECEGKTVEELKQLINELGVK